MGSLGKCTWRTAAKEADIYLLAAPLARTQEERSKDGEFTRGRHTRVVISVLKAIIEQLLHALYKFVVMGKCNVERRFNPSCFSAKKHVFLQHASQQPLTALIQ